MTTFSAPVDIVNLALAAIGKDTLTTLTENSKAARTANQLYEMVVEDALAEHTWPFATSYMTMTYSGTTGADENTWGTDWAFVWNLPVPEEGALLNTRTVHDITNTTSPYRPWDYREPPLIDFEIRKDQILCNADSTYTLALVYQFRADEADWSADFRRSVVEELKAVFIEALDREDGDATLAKALSKRRESRARHANADTRPRKNDCSISHAWSARGRRRGR